MKLINFLLLLCTVRLTTNSILGLPAFELHVGMNECPMLYNALVRIGAKYGLKNVGHRAMRSMYCEKGYLEIIQPYYIVLFICCVLMNFNVCFIHVNCISIALIRYTFFI